MVNERGRVWTGRVWVTGCLVAWAAAACGAAETNEVVAPLPHYAQIARQFAQHLQSAHLLQLPIDDTISQRAWTNYLAALDYDRSYFLQADIADFEARRLLLDDTLRQGDVQFAYDVFAVFKQRLSERCARIEALLDGGFDFDVDETYTWKRKDAPWPASEAEQDELWRRRIKNEVLGYLVARETAETNRLAAARAAATNGLPLAGEAAATNAVYDVASVTNAPAAPTPEEFVRKRYQQFRIVIDDSDAEWVLQRYLSSVAAAYDPHTAYMAPAAVEDFNIDMNLSLGGIGAVLEPEDGAAKVKEIIPGGPAGRDKRDIHLRPGDKIIGVGQDSGPVEDVLHLPLSQTCRKIRGKKGTRVVLNVISASDPSGASTRLVDLVRDDVRLEEQAATGHVARVSLPGGGARELGVIRLPTFYGSMTQNVRDPSYRSCTRDVSRIIADMNDRIEGLVLDLRSNGGGSLREAVELTGCFIRLGPVVQVREVGRIHLLPDRDPAITFRKPMIVLVNRISASASEIVAAALQDYGRAVIIGDSRTHGKGSVQTIVKLGNEDRLGSLKVTCANYYRISGGSTQVRGVVPDLVIPSSLDYLDLGEDKLPNAMPWSQVPRADYQPVYDLSGLVPALSTNSLQRLDASPRYARHLRLVEHVREISQRTTLPLRREVRRAQALAESELRRIGEEDGVSENGPPPDPKDDLVLDEALNVLSDLVDRQGTKGLDPAAEAGAIEVQDWLRRIFVP